MEENQVALGIDIGGTNTVFGIVDRSGLLMAQGHLATTDYATAGAFVADLAIAITNLIQQQGVSLQGIGVGAPNGNYYRGTIEHAPNLAWKGIVPLAAMITAAVGVPVYITNDANAAALGEMLYGAARGMKDFAVITLGTGLGSGFVANGALIYGHDGFAGELGHVSALRKENRLCGCGCRDCLETYVSATGLVRTAQARLQSNRRPSSLREAPLDQLTSKTIATAAAAGDGLALDVFDETAEILGFALANTAAIVSPEVYILTGGMALSGDLILKPTQTYMERYMPPFFRNKIKLLQSELRDKSPAILGASALFWQESASNP